MLLTSPVKISQNKVFKATALLSKVLFSVTVLYILCIRVPILSPFQFTTGVNYVICYPLTQKSQNPLESPLTLLSFMLHSNPSGNTVTQSKNYISNYKNYISLSLLSVLLHNFFPKAPSSLTPTGMKAILQAPSIHSHNK